MAAKEFTKLCECGCGKPAPIAKWTNKRWGHIKGQPVRFICGHHGRKHGHTGQVGQATWKSPTYMSWIAMKSRCEYPDHQSYARYGAQGIRVCRRWSRSFADFLADIGKRPSKLHTLDRYPDPKGNYEPGNVRWATKLQQANNTSRNRLVTAFGKTQTVAQWAKEIGIHKATLTYRLNNWSTEDALTSPIQRRG